MPNLDTINTTPLIGLDIETDTTIDGLDPRQSSVLAVAISGGGIEAVLDGPDERSVLVETDRLLASIGAGVLVTWNGSGFDLPFIRDSCSDSRPSLGLITRHDPSIAGRHDPLPGEPGRVRGRWYRLGHLDGFQAYGPTSGRTSRSRVGSSRLRNLSGSNPSRSTVAASMSSRRRRCMSTC